MKLLPNLVLRVSHLMRALGTRLVGLCVPYRHLFPKVSEEILYIINQIEFMFLSYSPHYLGVFAS